jgi:hypothetical protein
MKTAKLIAIIGIAATLFTACGVRKKDKCPSMGERTTIVK